MHSSRCHFYCVLSVLALTSPAQADIVLDKEKQWTLYGDSRLRFEADTNGRNATGNGIDDRARLRTRVRAGIKYKPDDLLTFDVRARTGSNQAQQSPHITLYDFHGNDKGDVHVNLDKWYVQAKKENVWAWAGRNVFPFWGLEEVFWDEDATLLGAAMGGSQAVGNAGRISSTAGVFTLPVGLRNFSGYLVAGDVAYAHRYKDVTYMIGTGLFDFIPDRDDSDAGKLADGNGFRKYTLSTWNARADWNYAGTPMAVSAEYLRNLQSYSAFDPDPDTAQFSNDRDGYLATFQVGDLRKAGQWLSAYYYVHVDGLAINSSFAQDEWVRWGSNGQNRSNDMKGHQFNLGYAFTDQLNLLGRVFIVESIQTQESSNRFRLDLNYRF